MTRISLYIGNLKPIRISMMYRELKCEICGIKDSRVLRTIGHYKDWNANHFGLDNMQIVCKNCYSKLSNERLSEIRSMMEKLGGNSKKKLKSYY